MAKFDVAGEQYFSITGQILEIQSQIRCKGGSPIDPVLVQFALQDIIENKFHYTNKNDFGILKLLSKNESIVIDECDGTEPLVDDEKVFDYGLRELNIIEKTTDKTQVSVYELQRNVHFSDMFGFFETDLNNLYLTGRQIVLFCKKHTRWLCKGQRTFFLCKQGGILFIIEASFFVHNKDYIYRLSKHPFDCMRKWGSRQQHRIVTKQS